MTSISTAAAAAKKRVNRPMMSAIPPANSMINAAQIQGSAGSNPLHEGADIGRRSARDLDPPVHQQNPAHCDAHDRTGERDRDVVERLEAGKQQLGFVLDVLRHGLSSLSDRFQS